jgi:hypothetical protein
MNANPAPIELLLPRIEEADEALNRPYPVLEEEEAPAKATDASGKAKY